MGNSDIIRASLSCSVELPAGTGKTETIAELVKSLADEGKRSLVLTHTHAGVDVVRRRMKKFGVSKSAVNVRTLDSWCFDLIKSFPELAGFMVGDEPDWKLTRQYHEAGRRATLSSAVVRMLCYSYDLLVVDEYQDCQLWQHGLVTAIAEVVPTCVLGDRMQGLFFFNDAQPVDWETDVESVFPPVAIVVRPWRWLRGNPELGEWLLQARTNLMNGAGIDLGSGPIAVYSPSERRDVLFAQPRHPATTVAISQWPRSAALLAQQLGGSYTMIEEIEGRHLREFATIVDGGDFPTIASATVQYAVACAFGIADKIDTGRRRKLGFGTPINARGLAPDAEFAINQVNSLLDLADTASVRRALVALSRVQGFSLYRREAWFGMLDALRLCETTENLTALEAVISVRNKLRFTGRRPESRIVGRPLLVKGLEFDHAVIDSPTPNRPYNAHELYVCLSRASISVALISDRDVLNPKRPER